MPTKEVITFDQFLQDVSPENLPFVLDIHREMEAHGYATKIEQAKSGFVLSYQTPATKKALLNYVFRKSGMQLRLYADGLASYLDALRALPPAMVATMEKQPACRRLLNPADCNQRCPMGYAFSIGEKSFQKCRYSCFLFPVTPDTQPSLKALVEKEVAARATA